MTGLPHGTILTVRWWPLLSAAWLASCNSASPAVCDPECGLHETCDIEQGPTCVCVNGYGGEPCEWVGVTDDPEFTKEDSWDTGFVGTALAPFEQGSEGALGIAAFDASATCNAGFISRVFEMPRYEDAEPLVAEVTFRQDRVAGVFVGYGNEGQSKFRRLRATRPYPEWNQDRFCLGTAGYSQVEDGRGGPVRYQIAAGERSPTCFSAPTGEIGIDRFEILPATEGECPAPGVLINGSAEPDQGGWWFEREFEFIGGSEAGFAMGVGESGTSAARIYKEAGATNLPAMFTQLSVPLPSALGAPPALRFWWRGAEGLWYIAELGTYSGVVPTHDNLDTLRGDGEAHIARYCLPPHTHGNLVDLKFKLPPGRLDLEGELVIDDVEIVAEPACGNTSDILDPSFDSSPYGWPGVYMDDYTPPETSVRILEDPERAHSGSGLLEIKYSSNQTLVTFDNWVRVPKPEENRLPQLVFWSKIDADPGLPTFRLLGTVEPGVADCTQDQQFCTQVPLSRKLPTGLSWQRNTVCLPAEWADRWFRVRIAIRPAEDEPPKIYAEPFTVLLDDFELRLTEGCQLE